MIFQIAPTPYLSILICSNRYQYGFLKVLLKKIHLTYPLGMSNVELFIIFLVRRVGEGLSVRDAPPTPESQDCPQI